MAPISARRDDPTPEISFAEVVFPDEADLGAGNLQLRFRSGVLNGEMPFFFVVEKDPGLHLGIRLRPRANEISIVLGRVNRSTFTSTSEKLGSLPTGLDARTQPVLKLEWEAWTIGKIELDGNTVEITRARSPQSEGALKMFGEPNAAVIPPIDGILPPNAPIPEHEATVFILVPQRNALPGMVWNHMAALMDTSQRVEIYEVRQGNTEIEIIREDDGSFVYSRSNPSVGVRTIRVPFGDVTTPDLTGYSILASWSPTKDTLVVSLMNNRAAEVVHREASVFAGSKLADIRARLGQFRELLDAGGREEEAHKFLLSEPLLLDLTSISPPESKVKLGDEYVTDFVIHDPLQGGNVLIEIERPNIRLFKTDGDRTAELNHAIEQTERWQAWVGQNYSYIVRRLPYVSTRPMCWLIAGRRSRLTSNEAERLNDINVLRQGILLILTYDELVARVDNLLRKAESMTR